jgi:hypothetical protein
MTRPAPTALPERLPPLPANPTDRIDLNLGGTLYQTTRQTAATLPRLAQDMLDAPHAQQFFFDRDGKMFGRLLDVCRPGNKLPSGLSREKISLLQQEAKYFGSTQVLMELKHLYPLREAVRRCKEASSPQTAAAYRALAAALVRHGELEGLGQRGHLSQAQHKIERAQALQPDAAADAPVLREVAKARGDNPTTWRALASCCLEAGDLEGAAEAQRQLRCPTTREQDGLRFGILSGLARSLSIKSIRGVHRVKPNFHACMILADCYLFDSDGGSTAKK